VKAVEITQAEGALIECARKARRGTVVLTKRGIPGAALAGIDSLDWEDLVVGSDPGFLALIERSRRLYKPGAGIPLEEMQRRYGSSNRGSDGSSRRRRRPR